MTRASFSRLRRARKRGEYAHHPAKDETPPTPKDGANGKPDAGGGGNADAIADACGGVHEGAQRPSDKRDVPNITWLAIPKLRDFQKTHDAFCTAAATCPQVIRSLLRRMDTEMTAA
jgi:hypothetical protein